MDDENYRDLAGKAWELYKLIISVQRALNSLFIDEFIDLDNMEREKEYRKHSDLPF